MGRSATQNISLGAETYEEASNIQSVEDGNLYQQLINDGDTYLKTANSNLTVAIISGSVAAVHYYLLTRKARKDVTEIKRVRAEAGL